MARNRKISPALRRRAAKIQVLLMDVDGTMTDGGVTLLSQADGSEMKMEFIYQKQSLKIPAYEEILRRAGVTEEQVAYVGDDLPDLPVMQRVGLAIAVGDAVPEVQKAAHYTTRAVAGRGAIRDAVELILKSKGIWEKMIEKARA